MRKYIHAGSMEFNPDKFEEIRNRMMFVKPFGGFWASAIDHEYPWMKWCEDNDFAIDTLSTVFEFSIVDEARICRIDSVSELHKIGRLYPGTSLFPMENGIASIAGSVMLDFEKLARDFDAIEVVISSDYGLYHALYGWDCDSILIFNKDIIKCL